MCIISPVSWQGKIPGLENDVLKNGKTASLKNKTTSQRGMTLMKKRIGSIIIAVSLSVCLLSACGAKQESSQGDAGRERGNTSLGASMETGDSVIVAMGPGSEPEAGFDPAYGWGAGEHVHEPLIQSTLTVTKADLSIGYDLATDMKVSEDGLTWTVTIRDDV